MPTVHHVADYFLWLAHNDRLGVDHLKLQKLVYYAQAYHLAFRDEPFFDGDLRAWAYGPVSPELWRNYRYRRDYLEAPEAIDEAVFSDDARELLEMIHARLRNESGLDLYRQTHAELPWIEADERAQAGGSDILSHETMRDYFRERLYDLHVAEAPPPIPREAVMAYLAAHPEVVDETRRGLEQLAAR
jgi:uncharacterized phage-associated protein